MKINKTELAALIPPKCMTNLAIGLAAITVLLWGLVIPGRMDIVRLDRRIQAARLKLNEKNSLMPLYETLKAASLKNPVDSAFLAAPARRRLKQAGLAKALLQIRAVGAQSGMKAVTVNLDLKNAFGDAKSVAVFVSCQGGFANFRTFLLNMCALPYVKDIAHISIKGTPGRSVLDLNTKIMVAMS